jgi:hypothetical protein
LSLVVVALALVISIAAGPSVFAQRGGRGGGFSGGRMGGFGGARMGGFGGFRGPRIGGFYPGGFGYRGFGYRGFYPGFYGGFGYPGYFGYGFYPGYLGYGLGYGCGLGYGGLGYGGLGYDYGGLGYGYPSYGYSYSYPYYGYTYPNPALGFNYSSAYVAPATGAVATTVTQGRYLGINEQPVTLTDGKRGMQVTAVYQGTPAERAGLQVGDTILSGNGYLTEVPGNLAWVIANAAPNNVLQMTVRKVSDGRDYVVTANLP